MRTSRVGAVALAAGMLAALPAMAQSSGYQWESQQQSQSARQGNQQSWQQEQLRQEQMRRERMAQQNRQYQTDQWGNRYPQQDRAQTWESSRPRFEVRDNDRRYEARDDEDRPFGQRVRGWFGGDDQDRNPFGVGDDVFDDKWDTGVADMGEYNAWDYPAEYRRDLQALREGRFHAQYGLNDPHDRARRGMREDDMWDGQQPWYRDETGRTRLGDWERDDDRVTTRRGWTDGNEGVRVRDDDRDLWDRVDRPFDRDTRGDRREGMFERDRVRVPLGTTEDVRGMERDRDGRRLRLGEPTRNPYGVGDDVFDDKWDTGTWDMGEHNAWDYPQEYQRDVQMLDRGQFHQQHGVSPDQDRRRVREGLRDDDIWDGRQPWYRDTDDTYRPSDSRVIRREQNTPVRREW
jgi:hypothetical protein